MGNKIIPMYPKRSFKSVVKTIVTNPFFYIICGTIVMAICLNWPVKKVPAMQPVVSLESLYEIISEEDHAADMHNYIIADAAARNKIRVYYRPDMEREFRVVGMGMSPQEHCYEFDIRLHWQTDWKTIPLQRKIVEEGVWHVQYSEWLPRFIDDLENYRP